MVKIIYHEFNFPAQFQDPGIVHGGSLLHCHYLTQLNKTELMYSFLKMSAVKFYCGFNLNNISVKQHFQLVIIYC